MLRKISFGLLCMAASLNSSSYADEANTFKAQSITVDYELVPNQPQTFVNYMFWAIEANCIIATEDASNDLFVSALAKKGKINNVPLSAGQSLQVTVHNTETLKINADSGAQVQITNLGTHTVKATCTA